MELSGHGYKLCSQIASLFSDFKQRNDDLERIRLVSR